MSSNGLSDALKAEQKRVLGISFTSGGDGGTIDIGLTVKHSVIISAGVTGDFFLGDADDIASALCGVEFAPEAVRAALTPFEGVLMNIDIDALVRGIFE
jgi:hypothetical protein